MRVPFRRIGTVPSVLILSFYLIIYLKFIKDDDIKYTLMSQKTSPTPLILAPAIVVSNEYEQKRVYTCSGVCLPL